MQVLTTQSFFCTNETAVHGDYGDTNRNHSDFGLELVIGGCADSIDQLAITIDRVSNDSKWNSINSIKTIYQNEYYPGFTSSNLANVTLSINPGCYAISFSNITSGLDYFSISVNNNQTTECKGYIDDDIGSEDLIVAAILCTDHNNDNNNNNVNYCHSADFSLGVGNKWVYSGLAQFGCENEACSVSKKWLITDDTCNNATMSVSLLDTKFTNNENDASIYINGEWIGDYMIIEEH